MYDVTDQSARRFVITGANSGTGKEAAKRLAAAGAEVVMAVRTPEKGDAARQEIRSEYPSARLEVQQVDLASLSSVSAFADRLLADERPINVLINNAGVMTPPDRIVTEDGFELQFGSNFLGPFELTLRLLASDQPRVITMASGAAAFGSIRFRDLQFRRGYRPWPAYAQSKLADLLMSRRLAELAESQGWPLLSTAAHPGYTRTNLQVAGPSLGRRQRQLRPRYLALLPSMEPPEGTEPLLVAATDPTAEQGGYYGPTGRGGMTGPAGPARYPWTARGTDLPHSLWAVAEQLTGVQLSDVLVGGRSGVTG